MTPKELVARMPEDFVELIGRFISDPDINTEHLDVQELMPSQPCVALIANHLGLEKEPLGTDELDQAKAWLDEQSSWQDRSVAVQHRNSQKKPPSEKNKR